MIRAEIAERLRAFVWTAVKPAAVFACAAGRGGTVYSPRALAAAAKECFQEAFPPPEKLKTAHIKETLL